MWLSRALIEYDPPGPVNGGVETGHVAARKCAGFSIDIGPAVEMGRSVRVDALVAKLSLGIRDRPVYWNPLRDWTHIRVAPPPRDLAPGVHRRTIRAVDEYGPEHEASRLIEVTP